MAISSYLKTFPNFMVLGDKLVIREKSKRTHKDLVALHNLLSSHILENDVNEFLNKQEASNLIPATDDYVEFCEKIKTLQTTEKYGRKRILFLLRENKIYLFKTELTPYFIPVISYRSEHNEVIEFLKNHFQITLPLSEGGPDVKIFYSERESSVYNNFIWDIPSCFLETLLAAIHCDIAKEPYYKMFRIPKANGTLRTIYAPNEKIKSALRKVNAMLQSIYDSRNESFQVAYKKGKSIVDNALPHKNNKYCVKIDIKDFFPSCKKEMVRKYLEFAFRDMYHDEIFDKFLDIITIEGGLFIGSPVSGTLANAIISKAVGYVKHCCDECGIEFTVYADDMSFSSGSFIAKDFPEKIFKMAFETYSLDDSLKINSEKTHGMIGFKRHITGVSFDGENTPVVRREKYREMRTILDHLSKTGETTIPFNVIRGRFEFIANIDRSEKIVRLVEKYKDTIEKFHLLNIKKFYEKRGRTCTD